MPNDAITRACFTAEKGNVWLSCDYSGKKNSYRFNNLYLNAHFFLKRKEEKFGPLLRKLNMESLVNSGKEKTTLIPNQASFEEGVETLNEVPKS